MNAMSLVPKRSLVQVLTEEFVRQSVFSRFMPWHESPDFGIDCCYDLHPSRKARIVALYSHPVLPEEGPVDLIDKDVASESEKLDLFELMAQWSKEDNEEDTAYMRELQKETRAVRHRSV